MQLVTVYRGMSRALGENNGLPLPNDQGVIFATFSREVAEKYASQWGDSYILTFAYDADTANIADMTDPEVVAAIVDRLADYPAWQGEDLSDPETRQQLVKDIIEVAPGLAEGAIMDDPGMIEAVVDMGYDGVIVWDGRDDAKDIIFVNTEVLIPLKKS